MRGYTGKNSLSHIRTLVPFRVYSLIKEYWALWLFGSLPNEVHQSLVFEGLGF